MYLENGIDRCIHHASWVNSLSLRPGCLLLHAAAARTAAAMLTVYRPHRGRQLDLPRLYRCCLSSRAIEVYHRNSDAESLIQRGIRHAEHFFALLSSSSVVVVVNVIVFDDLKPNKYICIRLFAAMRSVLRFHHGCPHGHTSILQFLLQGL